MIAFELRSSLFETIAKLSMHSPRLNEFHLFNKRRLKRSKLSVDIIKVKEHGYKVEAIKIALCEKDDRK